MNKKILILFFFFTQSILSQQVSEIITITLDGNNRSFYLYVPSSYDSNTNTPLMFNFHAGGGNSADHLNYTSDMRELAESNGFILVYPQASVDSSNGSTSWIDKEGSNKNDIFFVEEIYNLLNTTYNIDSNRVYACGYSEGAIFTYELGCRLSNIITGIAAVAGSMLDDNYRQQLGFNSCDPTHPTPVLLILGTNDDNYHARYNGLQPYYMSVDNITNYWTNYNNTDQNPIISQIPNSNTSDGSSVEKRLWENGSGGVEVKELKIIGGGHDWPGSNGNMDIIANEEIWNFLSRFNKSGILNNINYYNNVITVTPNPFNSFINFYGNKSQEIKIYDISGKEISVSINKNIINTKKLKKGIYFLVIFGETNKSFKMIKKD
jgi:polyhydroxybutyrate depolymerase